MLALGAQDLAAGRQDPDAGGASQDPNRHVRSCLDDVLAVIEHEQHLLIFEEGDQIGARLLRSGLEPEHGSERDRQLEELANRCQIDEPHPGPDDGHETLVRQLRRERPHGIRPVHDACHRDQQIVHGSRGALAPAASGPSKA